MAAYTNMAWPEDPYGTGQLWRAEPPLLASFAACCVDDDERAVPVSYAAVYLRLHRTTPVDATAGFAFGFRAVSATSEDDLSELVRLFDLDVMRARRLAKIVAGYRLADDLFAMEAMTDGDVLGRGIRSLAEAWDDTRRAPKGMASMFDVAHDVTEGAELADAAAVASIDTETVQRAFQPQRTLDMLFETAHGTVAPGSSPWLVAEEALIEGMVTARAAEWLAACSTERALISALVAARLLDRYSWDGALDVGTALAANVGDCFPSQDFVPQEQPM